MEPKGVWRRLRKRWHVLILIEQPWHVLILVEILQETMLCIICFMYVSCSGTRCLSYLSRTTDN